MEKGENYIIHICILSGNALEFLSVLKFQEKSVALFLFCSAFVVLSGRLCS